MTKHRGAHVTCLTSACTYCMIAKEREKIKRRRNVYEVQSNKGAVMKKEQNYTRTAWRRRRRMKGKRKQLRRREKRR